MRSVAYIWLTKLTLVLLGTVVALCTPVAAEVKITQDISPSSGSVEDIFVIEISVSGPEAQQFTEPIFPASRDFTIQFQGKSSQHSIIQGQVSSSTTYTFSVTPNPNLKPGHYQLPQGKFELQGGQALPLKVIEIPIRKADRKHRRNKLGVDFTQIVDNQTPYVGQQVLYRAEVTANSNLKEATLSDPNFPNAWVESFGDTGEKPRRLARSNVLVYSVREALFPIQAGELSLPARELLTTIRQPSSRRPQPYRQRFFDIWPSQPYTDIQRRLVAPALQIDVRALPTPPEARLKHIPVGKVTLSSTVSQWTIKEGENISFKITLQGDANLRPYELPDAATVGGSDFKIYYDTPQLETKVTDNRIIFTKTFQIAMVPQKPGSFTLPVIRVHTFDPYAEKYKTLETEEHKIIVLPNPDAHKLISSTPPSLGRQNIDSSKKNITFLTEDLLPQHVGAHTFSPKQEFDSEMLLALLVLMPMVAIGWRSYSARFERLYGDPAVVRQRNAFKNALTQIAKAKENLEEASIETARTVLIDFIGSRYLVRSEAFTPTETGQLIQETLENEDQAQSVSKLLSELERLRYSAAAKQKPEKLIEECLDRVQQLILDLEKNSKSLK